MVSKLNEGGRGRVPPCDGRDRGARGHREDRAVHWGYEPDDGPRAWGSMDPDWVLCDEGEEIPAAVTELQPHIVQLPMADLAKAAHPEGRVNMLVLGLLGGLLGLPAESLSELAEQKLARKAADYREAATVSIHQGLGETPDIQLTVPLLGEPGACMDWLKETPNLSIVDFGDVGIMGKCFLGQRS